MDPNTLDSKNTPLRWKIIGKDIVDNDPNQLNNLDTNYRSILQKAATFTSNYEMGDGNQAGVGSETDPILITGISITEQDDDAIAASYDISDYGSSLNIKAVITPANADNKVVTFTSSSPAVARVTSTYGLIELLTAGTVTITARATDGSNVTGSVTFNVTE